MSKHNAEICRAVAGEEPEGVASLATAVVNHVSTDHVRVSRHCFFLFGVPMICSSPLFMDISMPVLLRCRKFTPGAALGVKWWRHGCVFFLTIQDYTGLHGIDIYVCLYRPGRCKGDIGICNPQ